MDKKLIEDKLAIFLKDKQEISAVYLFGSFLRYDHYNDIDLALFIDPNKIKTLDTMYEFKLEIELKRVSSLKPFEVKILNNTPLFFQYKVLREGKLVFCKDHKTRLRYENNVANEYMDFKPLLDYYTKCMYKNIREGYYGLRS